jgi:ATP-dependent DNA helicase DinG
VADDATQRQIRRIRAWADETETGDRAELDFEPSGPVWTSVSVGVRECPGANRCPAGAECFAEKARRNAQDVDIVVVNLHLFALDVVLGGIVLPPHDLAIIDEAHQTEDIVARPPASSSRRTASSTSPALAAGILAEASTQRPMSRLRRSAADELAALRSQAPARPSATLRDARSRAAARRAARTRCERYLTCLATWRPQAARVQATTALLGDLDSVLHLRDDDVAGRGQRDSPMLRVAPIDVAACSATACGPIARRCSPAPRCRQVSSIASAWTWRR